MIVLSDKPSLLAVLLFSLIAFSLNAQSHSLGIFDNHLDIGKIKHGGFATYNPSDQEYMIGGSGANMWFGADEFHYLWKSIQGDFIVRAEFEFIGSGADPHRKVGWMVRNNFSPDSPHVNATVHGDGLTSLQFRRKTGGETEEVLSELKGPNVIQLERSGNTYIMSAATHGQALRPVKIDMDLRNEVFVGLYVCSHNPEVMERAVFRNVRIIKPPAKNYQPYRDYIGSRLEIMDVETGSRKVLMTSAHSIQAPNWTPDGKYLIYNSNGFLYKYSLETGTVTQLNTGFAINNNNDHVLSFDGKQLAISHHNADDNNYSSIYVMPVEGSDSPKKITKSGLGASYLHGWSTDHKELVFTGQRKNKFDIYKVSVETGAETQLTDTEGLDDGPEFSPDGKFIYFNSTRTGAMQIWRMNTDGSGQQQLTFDKNYNDWFPHISPDNKWISIISYSPEVAPADHPFYKQVVLRLMPVEGNAVPKIIAYVYGGQGTINVPSWSPDSKKIAFVSNSNF